MSEIKNIHTLVEDIYDVMENGADLTDEDATQLGNAIANALKSRLKEAQTPRTPTLRASNLGADPLNLWYNLHGYEGEALKPQTLLMFFLGDIIEEVLLALAVVAGHTVEHQQSEVEIEGIKGHIDAVIDGHLVDVKSASPYSFTKFKDHTLNLENDAFGYITQLSTYVQTCEHTTEEMGAFLVMNKVTGELTLMELEGMEQIDPFARAKHMKEMMARDTPPTAEEAPIKIKPMGKSGNMMLDVPHSYHDQKANYMPELRKFIYSSGPVYMTHVAVEPKVVELDLKTGEVIPKKDVIVKPAKPVIKAIENPFTPPFSSTSSSPYSSSSFIWDTDDEPST